MVEHHAAGADPHVARQRCDAADQDLGRGARQAHGIVVFGQPVAVIAEAATVAGEFQGLPICSRRRAAFDDRRLVEDGELHVARLAISAASMAPKSNGPSAATRRSWPFRAFTIQVSASL